MNSLFELWQIKKGPFKAVKVLSNKGDTSNCKWLIPVGSMVQIMEKSDDNLSGVQITEDGEERRFRTTHSEKLWKLV